MRAGRSSVKLVDLIATAVAATVATACNVAPAPTPVAPAAATRVEVIYENHSDEQYVISIVGRVAEQQGFATVDPCSANAMSIFAEPPFEIGVGEMDNALAPQPAIATSDDFDEPENGVYRYFIRIEPGGSVTSGVLVGSQQLGIEPVC
jgi:hypothetical protein